MTDETLGAPAGLLRPQGYGDEVKLWRSPSAEAVACLVELFWSVEWTLAADEVRTQETLPYPSVHLVIEDGRALVYGVPRHRFSRELQGTGWVLGIKFLPGGFRPLIGQRVGALRGKVVPAAAVMLADPTPLVRDVLAADGPQARADAAQSWLASG